MNSIFGFIINPMEIGLTTFAILVGSAGLGIILFTVAVRVVLSPLQVAQLRNAKAMQRLQPMMQEIRKKHGKDRQLQTQKIQELYREHRVNPATGCLLLIVQFPILIGLFYALRSLASAPPGWPTKTKLGMTCGHHVIETLSQWQQYCYDISHAVGTPDRIFSLFHAQFLWLSNGLGEKDPTFILPVLAGITQWVQSRMMLNRATDPQQQMMNSMMNFMPLLIVFFAANYASGLSLYWVTSTIIAIAIQYRTTGWGLLPETLGKLFGGFMSPRTTTGARAAVSKNGAARKVKSVPRDEAPPVIDAPAIADGDGPTAANGKRANGKATGGAPAAQNAAAIRQRKKANRARGGRQSGRRG